MQISNPEHLEPTEMENMPIGTDHNMILVMGVTGSGKSYFINKLSGEGTTRIGNQLSSCTSVCQAVQTVVGNTKTVLIDTPGFDDTERSDTEILAEIAQILAVQYQLGIQLRGIVYLHRITDIRYQGSAIKTLTMFRKLCGEEALKNVLLVTTRWQEVEESIGAARETELREKFWRFMLAKGSTMERFRGDKDSAKGILSQLLGKPSVVLEIQRELIDDGKALQNTCAGAEVADNVSQVKKGYEEEIGVLKAEMRGFKEADERYKQDVENQLAIERKNLETALLNQQILQQKLGEKVNEVIQATLSQDKKKNKIKMVRTAVGILGMFIGLPFGLGSTGGGW